MSSNHAYLNKDFDLKIYASPSISPVYYNNPGYSFIHLDQNLQVEEITLRFLRLYMLDFVFGTRHWNEYKLSQEMGGIDLNSATQIRGYYQKMMNNPAIWGDFESLVLGHDRVVR